MPLDKQHTAGKQVVFQSIPSAPRIHNLAPCIHHYYPLLPFTPFSPPAAVGILFFWSINMSINQPFSLRSTPLMLQLLESERSDIFEKTWRYRKDTCQAVGISSVSDSPIDSYRFNQHILIPRELECYFVSQHGIC